MPADDMIAVAGPLISQLGGLFYFAAEASARAAELGLSPFQFCLLGRAGGFGDADATVVQSALGCYPPLRISEGWDAAKAIVPPREGLTAFMECCAAFGRRHLAGLPGLDAFCVAAEAVRDAASPAALPLYAGVAAEPLVPDSPGRAMQLVTVLREFRGGVHLLAVVACGLDPRTAHYLSRPDLFLSFGWGPDDVPAVTDEDRARLLAAEELTGRLMEPAFGVLDQDGRDALMHGLRMMRKAIPARPERRPRPADG